MRSGIRKALLNKTELGLKGVYEPNVPTKQTEKPYAVILQNDDTKNNEATGYTRSIEIWFYNERTSFKELDKIVDKTIDFLDLNTITDDKTDETFTLKFEKITGQDIIDEEWDALGKGIRVTAVSLHYSNETNTDTWLDALKSYLSDIETVPENIYLNNWSKDFKVPSLLLRVTDKSNERINCNIVNEQKEIQLHIVSKSKSQINSLLDSIEQHMIDDSKIPYNVANRRYMTLENLTEDREADMLTQGQLTIKLFKYRKVERKPVQKVLRIKHKGTLKE